MKIYVCIKQVPDTESKIKLKPDHSGIDTNGIKWIISPYDEYAIEEALQMKTRHEGSTITVISLGPKSRIVDAIRTALAMGADEGIAIDAPEDLDSITTAQALAKTIETEGDCGIVFTGKQAIDNNNASVSQQLASFLSLPHTTVVSKFSEEGASFIAEREIEGGSKEHVQLNGPCVIGANKGLNTPRYASLPGIMKAKKKPLKEIEFASLDLESTSKKINFTNYQLPADKPPVQMLDGEASAQASSLVSKLREEAKVL